MKENKELLKRKWPSLTALKNHLEREGVEILYFDGSALETKTYRYTLVSPELFMVKI